MLFDFVVVLLHCFAVACCDQLWFRCGWVLDRAFTLLSVNCDLLIACVMIACFVVILGFVSGLFSVGVGGFVSGVDTCLGCCVRR